MPAAPTFFQSVKYLCFFLSLTLLVACSRDNPLSIPEPEEVVDQPYCLDGSPYLINFLESVGVSNTNNDFDPVDDLNPVGPDFMPLINTHIPFNDLNEDINPTIQVTSPFLINSSTITPKLITDTVFVDDDDSDETVEKVIIYDPIILEELEDSSVAVFELANELQTIRDYDPLVNSLSVRVTITEDGSKNTVPIDEDTTEVSPTLVIGSNEIVIEVEANFEVPRTSIDCVDPLTREELSDKDFEEKDRYRTVSLSQSFPLNIDRQALSTFQQSELDIIGSENDNLGKVMVMNDDYLFLGVPNEAEGRVHVFNKIGINSWQLHSTLLAPNGDLGDSFGAALALDGDILLVSAPGEDSFASGIHLEAEPETTSLQLNNSAESSGAVYLFKLNSQDNWENTHYFKPNENVISDGNFNRGFGTKLAIRGNGLFITAPLEDSELGDFSDSSIANSGAVYFYELSSTLNDWRFNKTIKAVNPGVQDQFGSSIAINGELIVIGAPFEDNNARSIFDFFNFEPGTIGDEDDEESEVIGDPPFEDNNLASDSGAVYVFEANSAEIIAHLKSTNSDPFDFFGTSLALFENTLLVSAPGEDSSGKGINRDMSKNDSSDSGAAYVFKFNNQSNVLAETAYIKANDSQSFAAFGRFMTIDEDNIFISAPLHDSDTLENNGKVYFYKIIEDSISQNLDFQVAGTAEQMRFGSQIAQRRSLLSIGASGFVEGSSGSDEPFSGAVFTYE
ncbi:MAG: FG-GAP repeat protein [Oleiphilus sp.]